MLSAGDAHLTVEDLHVNYGEIKAVRGVSFVAPRGKIVCLLGANGAGKTTVLKTISGLLRPARGRVLLAQELICEYSPHEIVRRKLCQVPEGRGIFANLTVEENLDLGAWSEKKGEHYGEDLEQGYTLFPRLKERRKQRAGTLSGGEQQMLAIARALMGRPQCLLLDEPSLGLAPQVIEKIFSVIEQINKKGVTVLLVEQNAAQALAISHFGVVLETGTVKLSGPADQLLRSDEVRQAYLGES